MIGLRSSPYAIDTVGNPLEETGLDEPRQRAPGDVSGSRLLERDEPPLPLGNVANARMGAGHAAKCNTCVILCSINVAPAVGFEPTTK